MSHRLGRNEPSRMPAAHERSEPAVRWFITSHPVGDTTMSPLTSDCRACSRREMLKVGALAAIPFVFPPMDLPLHCQQLGTANGGTDPFPIPWLDKNGSHNQPAGPDLEPSHIYHFKGRVARSSTFTGMGTDNAGNRVAFGSPTTDYGVMQGEYWAARSPQQGAFTHI